MRDLVNKCIKELIDKTLPTKTIVSRVRRKDHTRFRYVTSSNKHKNKLRNGKQTPAL